MTAKLSNYGPLFYRLSHSQRPRSPPGGNRISRRIESSCVDRPFLLGRPHTIPDRRARSLPVPRAWRAGIPVATGPVVIGLAQHSGHVSTVRRSPPLPRGWAVLPHRDPRCDRRLAFHEHLRPGTGHRRDPAVARPAARPEMATLPRSERRPSHRWKHRKAEDLLDEELCTVGITPLHQYMLAGGATSRPVLGHHQEQQLVHVDGLRCGGQVSAPGAPPALLTSAVVTNASRWSRP